MRSTENKKVTVTAVDSKYRCNLCGHLTNNLAVVAHSADK